MFLSNTYIKNYRSIKDQKLKFYKGKNVIVGKNNAGKSNIVKAINLILGESSPTYAKTENITDNDFFNGSTDEPIYICCLLQREINESLNYNEIYNCTGFYCHAKDVIFQKGKGAKPLINEYERYKLDFESDNLYQDFDAILNIDPDDNNIKKVYINPKLRNQRSFEDELDSCFQFGYIFRATKEHGKIIKDIRFIYREDETMDWRLAFSAPIRNEFIQCALIPSFRDPNNILRINQWSWYGKLLKKSINGDDDDLTEAFKVVKSVSDGMFESLKKSIGNTGVKVAFPNTEISFQFNPDTKIDIYKSTLIYVNDGFNSLLEDKGSGIQSAVIIGLFHYYTRNIAHRCCSLLVLEEPELYLHPQARRVISSRIDEFISDSDDENQNQVILTTHSPEFISTAHDNLNIILAKKGSDNSTNAFNVKLNASKDKQILVKIQNAEMFFADCVILVEGGEKYILEAFCKYFGRTLHPILGENWLDENNISVISVGGKTEFYKYYNILNDIGIRVYILSDFDFFLRQFAKFITKANLGEDIQNRFNGINGKITKPTFEPTETVNEIIANLIDEISKSGYKLSNKDIISRIKEQTIIKNLSQINPENHEEIQAMREELKLFNIFFLDGELENIYTERTVEGLSKESIGGKEERPIYLASQILNSKKITFEEYIDITQYNTFIEFVAVQIGLIEKTVEKNEIMQESNPLLGSDDSNVAEPNK